MHLLGLSKPRSGFRRQLPTQIHRGVYTASSLFDSQNGTPAPHIASYFRCFLAGESRTRRSKSRLSLAFRAKALAGVHKNGAEAQ